MSMPGHADSLVLMDLPAMNAMENEVANISMATGGKRGPQNAVCCITGQGSQSNQLLLTL